MSRLTRSCNKLIPKDKYTTNILRKFLSLYNTRTRLINEINTTFNVRKIRKDAFPDHVSENIAKFALAKKYKDIPNWNTTKGDLQLDNKQIEVKAFSSSGPSSFGHNENWDLICFVDATKHQDNIFTVQLINLSNKDPIWKQLMVNSEETFHQHCSAKRNPKISFEKIMKQLPDGVVEEVFHGNINKLLDKNKNKN